MRGADEHESSGRTIRSFRMRAGARRQDGIERFVREHEGKRILFLELGVGMNTPGIIKYPFWQMTYRNPGAVYACINYGEAYAPEEIAGRSVCIDGDIGNVLGQVGLVFL